VTPSQWWRRHRSRVVIEIVLALAVGVAAFVLAALLSAGANSADVPGPVLALVLVAGVLAIARAGGMVYAVPAGVVSLEAFDWYFLPPLRTLDAATVFVLGVTIVSTVGVAAIASYAGRRASLSEVARSEMADEQAALRRVATLVARGVSPDELFAAVAKEAGALLKVDASLVVRYLGEDEVSALAGWSAPGYSPTPLMRHTTLSGEVWRTGRAARVDYTDVNRELPPLVRQARAQSGVAAPIVVDGRLWGAMLAWQVHPEPLSASAEARLAGFTGLIATAISNTAGREELARLAAEQAALQRVATLVARGVTPGDVFAAVAREVGQLLGVDATHMARFESDGTGCGVASWSRAEGDRAPVGTRVSLEGQSVMGSVLRTGRPARMDRYEDAPGPAAAMGRELGLRSSVGTPIVVDQRLWGAMVASSMREEPLPADTESRITAFTDLVATAISNTESRAEAARLTDEQAALRRVATLVARAVPPEQIFGAVIEEVGRLLDADLAGMLRYEADATVSPVAAWDAVGEHAPLPDRWPIEEGDAAALIAETRRPARVEDWSAVPGPIAAFIREIGISSSVGAPILVEGRLWGALAVHTRQPEPLPADTESRLESFAELVATAIANAQARDELAASRARIVAAADDERRQVVRDLHDGAQQRLVHTVITLKLARRAMQDNVEDASTLLTEALAQAESATAEVRELAHGILPSALAGGGLRAGVEALASRMPVPVEIGVSVGRLPAPVEATAYFVVAEALTNVAKHAQARRAEVMARIEDGTLAVRVRDDGRGGARPDGSGLLGLADRLATLDGRLEVESPPDGGTVVAATIPLERAVSSPGEPDRARGASRADVGRARARPARSPPAASGPSS
jgi:signal transduction histidine kinase/uncharacterized protein YoaH (UPF0181 family)